MAPRMRLSHFFIPTSHAIGACLAAHIPPILAATLPDKVPVRILRSNKAGDEAVSPAALTLMPDLAECAPGEQ